MSQLLSEAPRTQNYKFNLNHKKYNYYQNTIKEPKQSIEPSYVKKIIESLDMHHIDKQTENYQNYQMKDETKYQLLEQINRMKQKQKQLQRINNVLVSTIRLANLNQKQNWKDKYEKSLREKLQLQLQKQSLLKQLNKNKNQSQLHQQQMQSKKGINSKKKVSNILSGFNVQIKKKGPSIVEKSTQKKNSFISLTKMNAFMSKIEIKSSKSQQNIKKVIQSYDSMKFQQFSNANTTIKPGLNTLQRNSKKIIQKRQLNSTAATVLNSNNRNILNKGPFNNQDLNNVKYSGYYQKLNNFLSTEKSIRNIQQKKLSFG